MRTPIIIRRMDHIDIGVIDFELFQREGKFITPFRNNFWARAIEVDQVNDEGLGKITSTVLYVPNLTIKDLLRVSIDAR